MFELVLHNAMLTVNRDSSPLAVFLEMASACVALCPPALGELGGAVGDGAHCHTEECGRGMTVASPW